jgi:DNA-binding NarL/FixJ family response regulator
MPLRCVIVDDNPGFLNAARLLLEQEGLQVVGVATSGDEALRAVAELRPDVTLLDIDLGGESGFDVARRLVDGRDSDPGQLILISTHSEEDLVDLIKESPAIGFLGKPWLSATTIKGMLETPRSSS